MGKKAAIKSKLRTKTTPLNPLNCPQIQSKVFFQEMTKQEQKELKECISQHPEKDQLSQIVDKILRAKPRQRTDEEYDKSRDQKGIIRRLGSLFSRD